MISRSKLITWLRPLVFLAHNPVTLTGAVLTTSSALTMIGFWVLEVILQHHVHPYAGIILFLVLPTLFVLGLLLMPIGALLRRQLLRRAGLMPSADQRIDFGEPFVRQAMTWIMLATGINVVLFSTATYRGVQYMDSVEFCGRICHSVMAPEYTAYLDSPHSRVSCTECHIGPGASWFARSKLSGARQVFAVALGTYSRPIPSPVRHLRPSRETCEQCHWPQKFHGDKLVVRTRYDTDAANTPLTTVLILKLGGRGANGAVGIHGQHFDAVGRVHYVASDPHRQVIPRVTYRDDDGKTLDFVSSEVPATPEDLTRSEDRTMDCIDCHNRPTHAFDLPERAVDRAITQGRISRELPFIKKKGVELLRTDYPDRDEAARRIIQGLAEYYRTAHSEVYRKQRDQVEAAADQLWTIYARNVFPEMKVGWGTYPNNLGHEDFPGCFRCHDDTHKTAGGRTITQDCDACHTILAQDETNPKILADIRMSQSSP